jgi:hypothetical protein
MEWLLGVKADDRNIASKARKDARAIEGSMVEGTSLLGDGVKIRRLDVWRLGNDDVGHITCVRQSDAHMNS